MACCSYSGGFIKKISSFITKLSGRNERERRAFEEAEPDKKLKTSVNDSINDAIEDFGGYLLFLCYDYLDNFKKEPMDFDDIFEYLEYKKLRRKILSQETNLG